MVHTTVYHLYYTIYCWYSVGFQHASSSTEQEAATRAADRRVYTTLLSVLSNFRNNIKRDDIFRKMKYTTIICTSITRFLLTVSIPVGYRVPVVRAVFHDIALPDVTRPVSSFSIYPE